MPLTASQVTMFSNWVTAGGNLIAMRPDKQLAGLLGLTDAASTRANAYLLVNTASGPGAGIVNETIQYHGTADLYTLNGASSVATLYATATTATSNPAVTLRNVGANGGQAAAFTYDLARSVVYTRQGNPAWSGQNRDGQGPIRSNDLFYGNASFDPQPDWVDLNKVAIPQADEQQRLLANLVPEMNLDNLPLPRFWYLPRGEKAAVVMTGDDHATRRHRGPLRPVHRRQPAGLLGGRLERDPRHLVHLPEHAADQRPGRRLRRPGLRDRTARQHQRGRTGRPAQLDSFYATQLAQFQAAYPSLPAPVTNRTHAIVWSDYATQPKVESKYGIRFDTNYYYFPAAWIQNRPGLFTGSGMPMRFADVGRHPDRRLPGRHPDDRRVGPELPVHGQRAARRGPGRAGLLRRLHRQHAHRPASRRPAPTPSSPRPRPAACPSSRRGRCSTGSTAATARRSARWAGMRRRARSASPSRPARAPTGWRRWCRCARPPAC